MTPPPTFQPFFSTYVMPLASTIVGGLLVIFTGWVSDRRKDKEERRAAAKREKVVLTAMFVVRNYLVERLNEWEADGRLSKLEPLRFAQSYIQRLTERAPESEAFNLAVFEVGLKLDAVIGLLDRQRLDTQRHTELEWAKMQTDGVNELLAAIETYDLVSRQELIHLDI